MKYIFILSLVAIIFVSCKKDQPITNVTTITPPVIQGSNKMAGKWNIISVTVIPLDSTMKTINNGTVYTEPSYYYFQFNADNSWVENLGPSANGNIGESGNYVLHADTSFTLTNISLPSNPVECKIDTLTATSFIFSHQKPTLFNGVTPGYLEYVFELQRG